MSFIADLRMEVNVDLRNISSQPQQWLFRCSLVGWPGWGLGLELKPVCYCQKNIAAFKHFRRVLLLPYNFIRHILNTLVLCWLGVLCASYNLFGLNALQWLSYGSFCLNSLILVATEGVTEYHTKLVLVQPMWNQLDGENDEMSI